MCHHSIGHQQTTGLHTAGQTQAAFGYSDWCYDLHLLPQLGHAVGRAVQHAHVKAYIATSGRVPAVRALTLGAGYWSDEL